MDGELKLFIPIQKVDEEKRLIYGRVTEESPDSAGEIFDYETSKPYFEEWVGYFQKATDGKSCGNLRAMHDAKKAVGNLPQVSLLDKEKAVEVVAKVVDDEEWNKTLEGVYTGFSQGGKYVKKWYDGKHYRYTAQPNEISLVDYPMLKTATFSLVKINGIVEEVPFKRPEEPPLDEILKSEKLSEKEITDLVFKFIPLKEIDARWSKEEAIEELKKVAERKDVNPESGKKEYGDVKFADEKNKKYPIDTEEHIRAAWNYINKPKNAAKYSAEDVKSIKAKIVAAWKSKIDKDGPPSAKESEKVDKIETKEIAQSVLKKYAGEEIGDVASAIYALQSIAYLYEKEAKEGEADQVALLKACIENLKKFIASEIMEADEDDVMTLAEKVGKLLKAEIPEKEIEALVKAFDAIGYELKKRGAAISAGNLTKIQAMHDNCVDLGAKCNKEAVQPTGDMAKVISEKDEALKKVSELTAKIDEMTKAETAKIAAEKADALKRAEALAKENETLKKSATEKDEALKKVVALATENEVLKGVVKEKDEALQKVEALTTEKDALVKEVIALKKEPEPAKGAIKAVPVAKAQDSIDPAAAEKIEGPKDPLEAIKKSHTEPRMWAVRKIEAKVTN